ncbi:MAG: DUF6387 family protein [Casimicrobiaceae bacterium]
MVRPRKFVAPPPWFKLSRYTAANAMDAADWYLNLGLRGWIARTRKESGRRTQLRADPLVRRLEALPFWLIGRVPSELSAILDNRLPRSSVELLRTDELYSVERKLPEQIREFGRNCKWGETLASDAPSGFAGPLDHLIEPRRLSLFARVDLSMPDKEIAADLRDFLARERAALGSIGGPQPYREALRSLGNRNAAKLKTFATLGVLPFIDLDQWAADTAVDIPASRFADLLEIADDRLRETRDYATLLLNDFVLRGWLLRSACEAIRKTRAEAIRKFSA